MHIEQIYTGCLAQGAYYIHSNGEAAIIDPLREVEPYLARAEKDGVTIKYIFETHFHADFVSGHLSLAEKTGATIVYGPTAKPSFDAHIAEDGEVFTLGNVQIVALHTPGHTMESTTYLLKDESGNNHAIFTGDTLFLGDVGRPDLAQKAANLTQEQLAGLLYRSLQEKIMPLEDSIIVYPAHGAGSACGKNMSKETVDTLGNQKRTNYALRAGITEAEFIKEVTDGLLPPPGYFPMNVKMNKEGYLDIDEVMQRSAKALSPAAFEAAADSTNALLLDVRSRQQFAAAHVPGSIFIGLEGSFAPWVGELIIDVQQPILLIVDKDKVEESITRLSRVGFDHVLGYLEGGVSTWQAAGKETSSVKSITATEFADLYKQQNQQAEIYDVRRSSEYESEHVENAHSTPLNEINKHFSKFPTANETPFYIHCAGGYRSMIAASILKARGIHHFVEISDGFKAIAATDVPTTAFVCPNSVAK